MDIIAILKAAGIEIPDELQATLSASFKAEYEREVDKTVSGLKNKNEELLKKNQKAAALEKLGLDAEQIEKILSDNKQRDFTEAMKNGRLDEYLKSVEDAAYNRGKSESSEAFANLQKQIEEKDSSLKSINDSWNKTLTRQELTKALQKVENFNHALTDDVLELVLSKNSSDFEVVDSNGKRVLMTTDKNMNADNKPKTVSDKLNEIIKDKTWAFNGQSGTGDFDGNQNGRKTGSVVDDIDNASDDDIFKEFGL